MVKLGMENGGKEIRFSWQYPLGKKAIFRKPTDDLAPLRGWGAKGETKLCTCTSITSILSVLLNIHSHHKTPTFVVALFIPQVWMINSTFGLGSSPKNPGIRTCTGGLSSIFAINIEHIPSCFIPSLLSDARFTAFVAHPILTCGACIMT